MAFFRESLERELRSRGPGTKHSQIFSVLVHQEAVQRVSIMVHIVSHDLKCCHLRDCVTIQGLLEDRQEIEDSDWLRAAEAAALHLVSDSAGLLAVVARVRCAKTTQQGDRVPTEVG